MKEMKEMKETTRKALNKYGAQKQLLKLAEECNELSAAIVRGIGDTRRHDSVFSIASEAADVVICLEYVRMIFGENALNEAIKAKVDRLKGRLNNDN